MVDSQAIPWRVEGRVTFPLLMAVTEEVNPEKMMTREREREGRSEEVRFASRGEGRRRVRETHGYRNRFRWCR